MEELEKAIEAADLTLRGLVELCIQLGAERGVENYLISPEFEEEACEYCREMGWKEPA